MPARPNAEATIEHRTSDIEHPTLKRRTNAVQILSVCCMERSMSERSSRIRRWMFDVRCPMFVRYSMLDVRCPMSDVRPVFDVGCSMSDVRCSSGIGCFRASLSCYFPRQESHFAWPVRNGCHPSPIPRTRVFPTAAAKKCVPAPFAPPQIGDNIDFSEKKS